jgi:hypothetical protein
MFHLPLPIAGRKNEPTSVVHRTSRGYTYSILKYHFLNNEYDYNSERCSEYTVITDELQTKIFAYMAPRLTARIDSISAGSEENNENPVIEVKAALEGTMVTFFWNEDTNEWNICSRNGVGCDYSYFHPTNPGEAKPKTFREMVLDAFRSSLDIELGGEGGPVDIKDLNDVQILQELSKSHCYTCVLQHPENHIVYSTVPSCAFLRLVRIYERNAMPPLVSADSDICYRECLREIQLFDEDQDQEEEDRDIRKTAFRVFGNPNIRLDYLKTKEDLRDFTQSVFDVYYRGSTAYSQMTDRIEAADVSYFTDHNQESLYYPPAWILTNQKTGHICEISNPFYEHAKQLRNMQPNMRYQYLDLRKNRKLQDYLHAFPRYYSQFAKLTDEYDQFITAVYNAYVKYYIMRIRENIPKRYFVHAARIHHGIYLASNPRTKINRRIVEEYFEKFESTKMFYYLTERDSDSNSAESRIRTNSPALDSSDTVDFPDSPVF